MTYTVIASNPDTREIGIASTTMTINFSRAFPFHTGLVPDWTERGLICAPMATINPHNGHKMIELWNAGLTFHEMIPEFEKLDEHWTWRQVGAVSATGEVFSYTGSDAWDHASHIEGDGSLALGNYMDGAEPVKAMAAALEEGRDLAMDERLMRAIEAGRAAGGQGGPEVGSIPESWAIIQVFNDKQPWPAVDVRVDFDVNAVAKLRRLLTHLKRMDPVMHTMCFEPAKTPDVYGVVFEMFDAQV